MALRRPTIELDPENQALLVEIAEREQKTPNEVLRDLLHERSQDVPAAKPVLEPRKGGEPWVPPAWVGSYGDDEVTSSNVEDWLQANWQPE